MPAPKVSDTMDVHIDTNTFVAAPRRGHGQVRHLRAHAGEGHEAFNCVGDVAVEAFAKNFGSFLDVGRFVSVEADLLDELLE